MTMKITRKMARAFARAMNSTPNGWQVIVHADGSVSNMIGNGGYDDDLLRVRQQDADEHFTEKWAREHLAFHIKAAIKTE